VNESTLSQDSAPAIVNVSGYRFIELENLTELQADMLADFNEIGVKGTVLLADEGINAALAGTAEQIVAIRKWFSSDERFQGIWLKESLSADRPFSKMKVRIRPEIITFDPNAKDSISPAKQPAPNLSPDELKQWLDEDRPITLLDTRNFYEVESGTFMQAKHLDLSTFK